MKYKIFLKPSTLKEIREIPGVILKRVRKAIEALGDEPFPSGSQKIHGYEGYYRLRIGQYRIIYEVQKTIRIITIVKIGHRKDVYEKLRRM